MLSESCIWNMDSGRIVYLNSQIKFKSCNMQSHTIEFNYRIVSSMSAGVCGAAPDRKVLWFCVCLQLEWKISSAFALRDKVDYHPFASMISIKHLQQSRDSDLNGSLKARFRLAVWMHQILSLYSLHQRPPPSTSISSYKIRLSESWTFVWTFSIYFCM